MENARGDQTNDASPGPTKPVLPRWFLRWVVDPFNMISPVMEKLGHWVIVGTVIFLIWTKIQEIRNASRVVDEQRRQELRESIDLLYARSDSPQPRTSRAVHLETVTGFLEDFDNKRIDPKSKRSKRFYDAVARFEFSEFDLSGLTLKNRDLTSAILNDANLEEADLRDAILVKAQLRNAKLAGADLRGAKLSGVILDGAQLRERDPTRGPIIAKLKKPVLAGASLKNTILHGVNLAGADLRDADLSNAKLSEEPGDGTYPRVPPATLESANLTDAKFAGAELTGVNFAGAITTGTDFRGTDLSGTIGLTSEQIASALTDETTTLPAMAGAER